MADWMGFCKHCGEKTGHLEIRESRLRICSICGTEQAFKKGEKGPPERTPVPVEEYLPAEPAASEGKVIYDRATGRKKFIAGMAAGGKTDRKTGGKMKRITDEQVQMILKLKAEGVKDFAIAKRAGCSVNTVWQKWKKFGKKGIKKIVGGARVGEILGDVAAREAGSAVRPLGEFKAGLIRLIDERIEARIGAQVAVTPELVRREVLAMFKDGD